MKQESQEAPSTKASVKRKRISKKKPKGLGDVVESVAKATGLDKVVRAVVGEDCGCNKRKVALNKRFPFTRIMTDAQKEEWLKNLRPKWKTGSLTIEAQANALNLYAEIFRIRHEMSSCGSCVNTKFNDLEQAYLASCEDSETETES